MQSLTYFFTFHAAITAAVLSCDDGKPQDGKSSEEWNGIHNMTLIHGESSGGSVIDLELDYWESKTIDFKVCLERNMESILTVELVSEQSTADEFNRTNGTDYEMLPRAAWSLSQQRVKIFKFHKESIFSTLMIVPEELSGQKKYILPVSVGEISGADAENITIDKYASPVYVLVSVVESDRPRLLGARDDDCFWDMEFVSSETYARKSGYAIGWGERLIDGNETTYWQNNYSLGETAPFEFVIDMKKNVKVHGVRIIGHYNDNGNGVVFMTSEASVSVASDITFPIRTLSDLKDNEYRGKTSFTTKDLPLQTVNDVYLTEPTKGRYLRLTLGKSYGVDSKDNQPAGAWGGGALSEIKVWGRFTDEGEPVKSEEKAEGVTRFVTYNVATFCGNGDWETTGSLFPYGTCETVSDIMKDLEADAVCINEIDCFTQRPNKAGNFSNNIDQAGKFAEMMGSDWTYVYRAGLDPHPYFGGTYGEALAVKGTPQKKEGIKLRARGTHAEAEDRVFCVVEMDKYVLITTHLEHVSSETSTRTAQLQEITQYVKDNYGTSKKPVFLGGDLNAKPSDDPVRAILGDWVILSPQRATYRYSPPGRCLDMFLAYKNGAEYRVAKTKLLHLSKYGDTEFLSDHVPVMLDVIIP